MKKLGLALGVGASRGFAHLGILEELEANGIKPDYIAGGSMGSLIGGVYALHGDIEAVRELVHEYRKSDLYVVDIATAIVKSGVGKDSKFRKTVYNATEGKSIEDCVIPFKATAVDILKGNEITIDKGPLWRAIRASCSIPGVLPPLELDGMVLVDGGLLNRVPTNIARGMGAEVVIGVDALGDFRQNWKPKNFVNVVQRSFEIVDKQTFHSRPVDYDMMLTPSHDEVDPMKFNTKFKSISVEAGRQAVRERIKDIKIMLEMD